MLIYLFVYTIAFGITEILPILLLMFSFIKFGSTSNSLNNLSESESQSESSKSSLRSSLASNKTGSHYYKHIQDNCRMSSDEDTEYNDQSSRASQSTLRNTQLTLKTMDTPQIQNKPIVNLENFYKSSDYCDQENKDEEIIVIDDQQNDNTVKTDQLETREGKLKIALRQMMKDMGMDKSGYLNASSLEDSITYSFIENSKEED